MKINDKAICINNISKHYTLTLYNEYEILDKDDKGILVLDDNLFLIWIPLQKFITKQELRKMKLNSI